MTADLAHGSEAQKDETMPIRERPDLCPGVWRPWPADDGLLVRIRLVGGRVGTAALWNLLTVAETYGDGRVHLTSRANLQVRGLPSAASDATALDPDVVAALVDTGLLPTPSHELARNIMVSPLTGLSGGRADLRPVAEALDLAVRADRRGARLPGRFLFLLDDGRGDLIDRSTDLGLVALDRDRGQLRVGAGWASVVPLTDAATVLARMAGEFVGRRGSGPTAAWHVDELPAPLADPLGRSRLPDRRLPAAGPPPDHGSFDYGRHVAFPGGLLDRRGLTELSRRPGVPNEVVITPWRSVVVPEAREQR